MNHPQNRNRFLKVSALVAVVMLGLVIVLLASPVMAQRLLKQKFALNPYSEWGSGYTTDRNVLWCGDCTTTSPPPIQEFPQFAPQVQLVPSGSVAATELMVNQAGDVNFVSVSFDYDGDVVSVHDIRPGSIFDNMTEGVDYLVEVRPNYATPINPPEEMTLPADVYPWGVQADQRSYVDIAIINPAKTIFRQSGSLIRIDWDVENVALGVRTPVIFSRIDLKDNTGYSIAPCMGYQNPSTVPQLFGVPAPSPSNPNACYDPASQPMTFPYGDGPIIGMLEVSNQQPGLTFQVGLQGLSFVDYNAVNAKFDDVVITATTTSGTVNGNLVYTANGILDGTANVPVSPPYSVLSVSRPGYLRAEGTNIGSFLADTQVVLLAGDVDGSGAIDVLDLSLLANALNQPVNNSAHLEKMDFNGDGRVDIADLALASGNFRTFGPTPIR